MTSEDTLKLSSSSYVEPLYSTDPEVVVFVSWCVASDKAQPDEDTDDDGFYDKRMQKILDGIADRVKGEFPNLRDDGVTIIDGGHDNQFSPWSPRAITSDDSIYEPFFDVMTGFEDEAVGEALAAYPFAEPEFEEEEEPEPDESGYYYALADGVVIFDGRQVRRDKAIRLAEERWSEGTATTVWVNEEVYGYTVWRDGSWVEGFEPE